jgi:hypothetical protein
MSMLAVRGGVVAILHLLSRADHNLPAHPA